MFKSSLRQIIEAIAPGQISRRCCLVFLQSICAAGNLCGVCVDLLICHIHLLSGLPSKKEPLRIRLLLSALQRLFSFLILYLLFAQHPHIQKLPVLVHLPASPGLRFLLLHKPGKIHHNFYIFIILSQRLHFVQFLCRCQDAEKPEAGDLWLFCNNFFIYIYRRYCNIKRIIKREGLFIKKGGLGGAVPSINTLINKCFSLSLIGIIIRLWPTIVH